MRSRSENDEPLPTDGLAARLGPANTLAAELPTIPARPLVQPRRSSTSAVPTASPDVLLASRPHADSRTPRTPLRDVLVSLLPLYRSHPSSRSDSVMTVPLDEGALTASHSEHSTDSDAGAGAGPAMLRPTRRRDGRGSLLFPGTDEQELARGAGSAARAEYFASAAATRGRERALYRGMENYMFIGEEGTAAERSGALRRIREVLLGVRWRRKGREGEGSRDKEGKKMERDDREGGQPVETGSDPDEQKTDKGDEEKRDAAAAGPGKSGADPR